MLVPAKQGVLQARTPSSEGMGFALAWENREGVKEVKPEPGTHVRG